MFYFDVCEIGRESVKSVNALILASLIKELVNKYEKNHKSNHRRYYIKCKEKLEFTPKKCKKIGDDEGFESDANEEDSLSGDLSNEDAQSTTSSCCFVEDHVFKTRKSEISTRSKEPGSLSSTFGSIDSANSSGGSDSDELDLHSPSPSPVIQNKKLAKTHELLSEIDKREIKTQKEEYPIGDVIFCHTEPKYPTVIAWVIKKHQPDLDLGSRLGAKGVENFLKSENCLEVIVVKCKDIDNLKDLCSSYQEYSRRVKLDQYKSIKRRKDEKNKLTNVSPLLASRDVKVSLSDLKVANSSLIKASELSILTPKIVTSFRTDLKNSISLNSINKPEQESIQNLKTNQELKSLHQALNISVMKTQSLMNLSKNWEIKSDTLTRNGVPFRSKIDEFNLIQRTDLNGITHLEVSKTRNKTQSDQLHCNKSKLRKEIEGVILTDVESYAKKEPIRQRTCAEDGNSDNTYEVPPTRPERRKYLKKKAGDNSQPDQINMAQPTKKSVLSFYLAPQQNDTQNKNQKVLKGPYVRVQSWGNQNLLEQNLNTWKTEPKTRHVSKCDEKYSDRRRSKSAGRTPKKAPMAYRYVDITNDYHGNSIKCIPQKVGEVGGNTTNPAHNIRRRNSFDDIMNIDLHHKGNLKSVIKKNKKINDKRCEPKKVTFSAFATVQVVD